MKRQLLAAGAVLGFALTALAPAAVAEAPITLNAGASHWYFSSDTELQNMSTPWAGLEWAFDDNWAAEVSYASDDAQSQEFRGTSTDVSFFNLGLKYYGGSYVGEPNRFRPYAAVGLGLLEFDPNRPNGDSDDDTTINGGVGVRWMMTERFGASFDARLVYDTNEDETQGLASISVNYYLGDTAPKAPPAAPAPLDSDGDGVTDDMDQCPGTPAGTRVDAKGCPLPVARVASVKLKVNFAFDSTVVQEKYFADLGELAKFLKRFQDVDVKIDGYTDSVGPETYNQQLSQRRSQAVVDLLVNQYGIAANRLQAVGYGEANPVASNDTAAGRAENRRVMASLEVQYED